MNFKEMLLQAKAGRELAVMALLEMYKPLLVKYAIINGRFDEDLCREEDYPFFHLCRRPCVVFPHTAACHVVKLWGFGRIPKAFIIQIQADMPVIKGENGLVDVFFQ